MPIIFTFNSLFKIDKSGGAIIRFQILTCIAPFAAEFWLLTVLSLAWQDDLYEVSSVFIYRKHQTKRISTGDKLFLSQSN